MNASKNFVYGKDDALFGAIEQQQGKKPFGSVLDAGTGLHSLRWIATLRDRGMTEFTAVTADSNMQRNVQQEAEELEVSDIGNVVVGNWFSDSYPLDEQLGARYDTILADYLIGAMDGFSPYKQDLMIPKLTELLQPGGRLYIVGLQPIPDRVDESTHDSPEVANIICSVRQVRDACILLAGHRCYREYPVDWIHRQVQKIPGLDVKATSEFPILYRHNTILRQINVGRSKLPLFPSSELADAMKKVLDDLEQKSLAATEKSSCGAITLGFDYIVTAEKIAQS